MKTIEITNLPEIVFAHEYGGDNYTNKFYPQPCRLEIAYIVEGELTFYTDGVKTTAKKGDITCMTYERITEVHSHGHHTHRTVCATFQYVCTAGGIIIPPMIKAADGEGVRRVIDKILSLQNSYKGSPTREASLVFELLSAVDRAASHSDKSGEYMYVKKAKKYIAQNIHLPITQREIASHLGITPGYLCAVFKKAQGETLMQYINRTKLIAVRGIMQKERLPLYRAAAMYGYSDPNYVSRLYKKLFSQNITQ